MLALLISLARGQDVPAPPAPPAPDDPWMTTLAWALGVGIPSLLAAMLAAWKGLPMAQARLGRDRSSEPTISPVEVSLHELRGQLSTLADLVAQAAHPRDHRDVPLQVVHQDRHTELVDRLQALEADQRAMGSALQSLSSAVIDLTASISDPRSSA